MSEPSPLPFIMLHEDPQVRRNVQTALAPRKLKMLFDPFALAEEISRAEVQAVILQHPMGELPATEVAQMLRQGETACPLIVVAEGTTEEERTELAEKIGGNVLVLETIQPFLDSVGRARGDDAEDGDGPDSVDLEPEDVAGLLTRWGESRLALKIDSESMKRWCNMGLPPNLIAMLDGTRSINEIVDQVAGTGDETRRLLARLEAAECLEVASIEAASTSAEDAPAKPWRPPEPITATAESGWMNVRPGPELLLGLRRRRVTGLLFVETEDWTMRLDIVQGSPLQAAGGPEETGLGRVLVGLRYIDDAQHATLLAHARVSDRPLGEIAVQLGYVEPTRILAALWAQLEAKIRAIISLQNGNFRFYADPPSSSLVGTEHAPVETVIEEGLRADTESRKRILDDFFGRHRTARFRPTDAVSDLLPALRRGGRFQRLIRALEHQPLADVVAQGTEEGAESLLGIYILWAAGGLEAERSLETTPDPRPLPPPRQPRVEPLPSKPPDFSRRDSSQIADPRFVEAKLEASARAMQERRYADAVSFLDDARARDPKNPRLMAATGWAVFRLQPGSEKARQRATGFFEQALGIDPSLVTALVGLARVARLDGEIERARELLEQALRVDAANNEAKRELSSLRRLEPQSEPDALPELDDSSGFFRFLLSRRPPKDSSS